MNNADNHMKVDVMTMASEDGVQLALERYDEEPNSHDPKKLLDGWPLDLVPVNAAQISKKYSTRKGSFIDLSISELLGLGMLGQYFQNKDGSEYDLILSVEDAWHPQRESVISDGAIMKHGDFPRMVVQQVKAQNISGRARDGVGIEDEIIKRIAGKNKRMDLDGYPEKCALLVSVYTYQTTVNLKKIIEQANLEVFSSYYMVLYQLPRAEFAYMSTLGGYAMPGELCGDSTLFRLQRYENPYGFPNQTISH